MEPWSWASQTGVGATDPLPLQPGHFHTTLLPSVGLSLRFFLEGFCCYKSISHSINHPSRPQVGHFFLWRVK